MGEFEEETEEEVNKNVEPYDDLIETRIREDDAILVIGSDKTLSVYLPELPADEIAPENSLLVAAIATRLVEDSLFATEMVYWLRDKSEGIEIKEVDD